MKLDVVKEPTIDHKEIYDRNISAVVKKGYLISDIQNYIPSYVNFRGTLNQITRKMRPKLPKNLREIDFRLPDFKEWTLTTKGKQFL